MSLIDNRKELFIVDSDTGEKINTIHKGDKIISQRLYENWVSVYGESEANKGMRPLNIGQYAKVSDCAMRVIRTLDLTSIEMELIFYFLPMLHWNSNLIAHKNKKPIRIETLMETFGSKQSTIETALRGLRKKGILFVGDSGGGKKTFFNPYIFLKGRYIAEALHEMFADTVFYKAWLETATTKHIKQQLK